MEKKGFSVCAPGSTRELEFVRVRWMECIRDWGSTAPECVRVRRSGAGEGMVPLAEAEEVRWTFFLIAGLSGLAVLTAAVVCLRCGCGVCVRGGRWAGGWDGADWRGGGAA
jgi:hypothetical protein